MRETGRQKDRQAGRQRLSESERETDTETDRQTDRQRQRYGQTKTNSQKQKEPALTLVVSPLASISSLNSAGRTVQYNGLLTESLTYFR